ncbi:unnamed protein product [Owenia fusiformis]|uniref:Transcription initiation factor TFIID subunit 13 n=1 Tax=Owenia fusiformis TaxID=6347 RepID=A0A8J1TBP8_OWEFU|nr:unnamed protein product [Owenia fusiformis]
MKEYNFYYLYSNMHKYTIIFRSIIFGYKFFQSNGELHLKFIKQNLEFNINCGVRRCFEKMAEGEEEPPKDQFEDEDDDAPLQQRKKIFSKELRCMMYGFGDDRNPYTESVDLLEDLVVNYITETTKKALDVGRQGRIAVEDLIFLIRKDNKKYSRVRELLTMSEELRKARKAFDEVKYVASK